MSDAHSDGVRAAMLCVESAEERIRAAILAEREACASLVSAKWHDAHKKSAHPCEFIATAIRARGNP